MKNYLFQFLFFISLSPCMSQVVSNPELSFLKSFPGNTLDSEKRFVNQYNPFEAKFSDLLKWQFSKNPQKNAKKLNPRGLEIKKDSSLFSNAKDGIIWLGHASFFIRLNGITFLIDPVQGNAGPVKRHSEFPFAWSDFPPIDFILISHDHRDHCDKPTLKQMLKHFPNAYYLTGLNMSDLLRDLTSSQLAVQEAGWYQVYKHPKLEKAGIKLAFLPSRHWSRRGLTDTNKRLWGAFLFQSDSGNIYFSGDSGYDLHFKELPSLCKDIDVFIIGVGAYKPEWFMSSNHISPTDALKAFQESGAKAMLPMHYGTFDLSDEPMLEPREVLNSMGRSNLGIMLPLPGEVIRIRTKN